jgi:hypothetical protein
MEEGISFTIKKEKKLENGRKKEGKGTLKALPSSCPRRISPRRSEL